MGWYVVLPHWILKDDTFEEFCEKFEASWRRTGLMSLGVIGFELSTDGVEPDRKYTVRQFQE